MDLSTRPQHHAPVRVLPHIKRLDDCFGQFLVRVICDCGACREIEPEALARLVAWKVTLKELALRMRCSRCGWKAAEVVAVAIPRPGGGGQELRRAAPRAGVKAYSCGRSSALHGRGMFAAVRTASRGPSNVYRLNPDSPNERRSPPERLFDRIQLWSAGADIHAGGRLLRR
jgi:hypothetical protein